MNPAPNGYSAINFRLEGRTGSCFTGTWQLGKASSAESAAGELFSLNKAGLTGGLAGRPDASQQWKTNGDSIFGFKVGIGTTTPSYPLHMENNCTDAGTLSSGGTLNGTAYFGAGGLVVGTQSTTGHTALFTNSSGRDILFGQWAGSSNSEKMRITSGGNVLIGVTTTNKGLLRVAGNAEISCTLYFNGGEGSGGAIINTGPVNACATPSFNIRTMYGFNNQANYGAFMFIHTAYNNVSGKQGTITGIVTNGSTQVVTILGGAYEAGVSAPGVYSTGFYCFTVCHPNPVNSNTKFIALAG
jgi:hypothetical protein